MLSSGTLLLAANAGATVALTGCSATVAGVPAPPGGSAALAPNARMTTDPVAWTDQVCGSLLPFVGASTTELQIDQINPAAAVKAISDYLGTTVSAIDQALAGLNAAGPAPVADGDAFVAKLRDALTTVRSSFETSKTAIDKVDPNNTSELVTALPEVLTPLLALSQLQDPTTGLKANPALKAAAAKAPNCQKLNKEG